jgi:predicted AlkP superfamily phosphohydrolase/phosphomutase
VDPVSEKAALEKELSAKLEMVTDPENGKRVVRRAHLADEVYSGDFVGRAPDIIVGYDWGYRTSWKSALGEIPEDLLEVSKEKWSGDHCGATEIVPGILFSNKKIMMREPHLYDLAPTILSEFGVSKPADMIGRNIFVAVPTSDGEKGRKMREELKTLGYM